MLGFAGAVYGAAVAVCGVVFLLLAFQLNRSVKADRRAAHRLFVFSIFYLFALFAALLVDHGGDPFSRLRPSRAVRTVGPVRADLPSGTVRSGTSFINLGIGEV